MKEAAVSQVSDGSFIVREILENNQVGGITTHSSTAKLIKRIKEIFQDVEDEVDIPAEEVLKYTVGPEVADVEVVEERPRTRQPATKAAKQNWQV